MNKKKQPTAKDFGMALIIAFVFIFAGAFIYSSADAGELSRLFDVIGIILIVFGYGLLLKWKGFQVFGREK